VQEVCRSLINLFGALQRSYARLFAVRLKIMWAVQQLKAEEERVR